MAYSGANLASNLAGRKKTSYSATAARGWNTQPPAPLGHERGVPQPQQHNSGRSRIIINTTSINKSLFIMLIFSRAFYCTKPDKVNAGELQICVFVIHITL
jgi:hypothetical protein